MGNPGQITEAGFLLLQRIKMRHVIYFVVAIVFMSRNLPAGEPSKDRFSEYVNKTIDQAEPARRGYLMRISITEAVDEFNERQSVNSLGKTQPPLSEDEVVASVLGANTGYLGIEYVQISKLSMDVRQGYLSEGCYIAFNCGEKLDEKGEILLNRWSVWLVYGLNANPKSRATYDSSLKFVYLPIRIQTIGIAKMRKK